MEKIPEIRVVGNISEEEKEREREKITEALFNHFESLPLREQGKLREFERQKSEEEIALIDFANNETDELMEKAGVEPYDIPQENYHIVPEEAFKDIASSRGGAAGSALYSRQGIVFNDKFHFQETPVIFGTTAFHETLHLKGHMSLEAQKGALPRFYRTGVSAFSAKGVADPEGFYEGHQHFSGLHEAIVSAQEKKIFPKLLSLDMFTKDKEWLFSDEAKIMKEDFSEKLKVPEDEVMWVNKEGTGKVIFPYIIERRVLDYVCDEIQKTFPEAYPDADAVSQEFLNAHFTGKLLPIARLMEETFGEGSFRLLGNMTPTSQSAMLCLESLKKARIRKGG